MDSSNNLKKDQQKKGKMHKESEESSKAVPETSAPIPSISFDAYFRILMTEGKVQAHHKAPLKQFVNHHMSLEAPRADFDKIFNKY